MPIDTTKNFIRARVRKPSNFEPNTARTIVIDARRGIKAVIQRLKGKSSTAVRTFLFDKSKGWTKQTVRQWLKQHGYGLEAKMRSQMAGITEAKWTRKYINDLPDSAFLYIEPGGKKDDQGKTTPRSLRHFPYKNHKGEVDLPHLRNALARIPQSNLPDSIKRRVIAKARRIAKRFGINVSDNESATNGFLDDKTALELIKLPEEVRRGNLLKLLRRSCRLSLVEASKNSGLSVARIIAIESGDYPSDKEIASLAFAYHYSIHELDSLLSAFECSYGKPIIRVESSDGFVAVMASDDQEESFGAIETFEEKVVDDILTECVRLHGSLMISEERSDGTLRFTVPLIKPDRPTANGNVYTRECCQRIIQDLDALKKKHLKTEESVNKRTTLDIQALPDMLPTHAPRWGMGNPLLLKAGLVTGAFFKTLEDEETLFISGETLPTSAGRDISVLITRGLVLGVSLVGRPIDYEENEYGGKTVSRIHLVGADFTNEGANLIQFKSVKNAGFQIGR